MDEYSYIIIFARYICETKRIRNKITYSLPLGIAMLICVRKSAFFKSRAAHAALLSKMQIYEHILHRDTEAGVNNHSSAASLQIKINRSQQHSRKQYSPHTIPLTSSNQPRYHEL